MPYNGPDRRIVDREETPADVHAQSAAQTRFQHNPETGRAEDNNGHTIGTANFDGGNQFRELLIAAAFDQKVQPTKEQPAPAQLEAETPTPYTLFIESLGLGPQNTLKLKEMMSPANYRRAVETAKKMDPQKEVPTKEKIETELMNLTPERLKEICEMQEKPTIAIVVPKSFDEKLEAIDANKLYKSQDGKPQENLYCDKSKGSPYLNAPKMSEGKVTIADGIPHPEQLHGVSIKLGARRAHLNAKFAAKKMKLTDKDEQANLLLQSLIEAKETGNNSKIIDNWEAGTGTATILDEETLTESDFVAYSSFFSNYRQPYFSYHGSRNGIEDARGRASVQLMKF